MDERIIQVAKSWLGDGYDEETKAEVRRLLEGLCHLLFISENKGLPIQFTLTN